MIINELKTGPWNLTDLKDVKKIDKKVFSIFCCGGGSSMGYKLAGYDVLGGCEIDPEMAEIYKANHNPKYMFRMAVQEFNKLPDSEIPEELFNLDILDGSPPCSSFSMAGSREKKWGKAKKFREGQAAQVLDDLFFHFIETAKRLQPKVVIAENVKGMIAGNARSYVKQVFKGFKEAGYNTQLFLLNASKMGVPQRRERVFFIATKSDKKISLEFDEKKIILKDAIFGAKTEPSVKLTEVTKKLWNAVCPGEPLSKAHPKGHRFNAFKAHPNEVVRTLPASADGCPIHWNKPRRLSDAECCRIQTFPDDYNFLKTKGNYVCGMSVPPFMTQRVATEVYKQLLGQNG